MVYEALTKNGYKGVLAAPTGKAAKRIQEATGIEAVTFHRLLEFSSPGEPDPLTGKVMMESFPRRTQSNPVHYHFVLGDEYSMVDEQLHRDIMGGCGRSFIRVFGDSNQLPPIETDKKKSAEKVLSPFEKIIENPKMPSITLDTIHRQAENSGIIYNASRIRKGLFPTRKFDDFILHITPTPVDYLRDWLDRVEANGPVFNTTSAQIICPQERKRKAGACTEIINPLLQARYIPYGAKSALLPRHTWKNYTELQVFVGDKVIMSKNYYDLRSEVDKYTKQREYIPTTQQDYIFNGEAGVILEITEDDEAIIIDLGDRVIKIPPLITYKSEDESLREIDPRKDLNLAYAITTHKSQGSEYERIVYMLSRATFYMQVRSNLYTAVTRAKKHVDIISDPQSLSQAVTRTGR